MSVIIATIAIVVPGTYLASPYRIEVGDSRSLKEVSTSASDRQPLRLLVWKERPSDPGRRPAIVFIHGLVDNGPRHPSYAVLCNALCQEGFVVAAPWLRGYGSDALDLGQRFDPDRWNPLPDVAGAYEFLRLDPDVDPERIFVLGHSSGAGYAVMFGLLQRDVAGVISLSPGDLEKRILGSDEGFDKFRHLFTRHFGLTAPIPEEAFSKFLETQILAFAHAKKDLKNPGHPPMLFAIGDRERASDQAWLAAYSDAVAGEAEYQAFEGLEHSLNVRHRGSIRLYDRHIIGTVASNFAMWMQATSQ